MLSPYRLCLWDAHDVAKVSAATFLCYHHPVRTRAGTTRWKLAAARALAACVSRSELSELSEEYIIPSVFNKRLAPAVAEGGARAAFQTGTARWRGERPPGP
jgi:malic enzyme